MKAAEFNQLKKSVNSLSPKQKIDLDKYFLDPKSKPQVIKFLGQALDSWPHCQHDAAYKWGASKGRQRYRCKSCGKTYNAFTGSVLNGLQKSEVWEQYCQTMVDSKSLRAAAKECGINLTTAFN